MHCNYVLCNIEGWSSKNIIYWPSSIMSFLIYEYLHHNLLNLICFSFLVWFQRNEMNDLVELFDLLEIDSERLGPPKSFEESTRSESRISDNSGSDSAERDQLSDSDNKSSSIEPSVLVKAELEETTSPPPAASRRRRRSSSTPVNLSLSNPEVQNELSKVRSILFLIQSCMTIPSMSS